MNLAPQIRASSTTLSRDFRKLFTFDFVGSDEGFTTTAFIEV